MSNKYYNCLERNGTKYFKLEYTFEQYPGECCPFEKLFRHLFCQAVMPSDITYCESVFRKSLHENVEVFLAKVCTEQHSLSYRYLWTGTFCVPRYPISIRVWGIVPFISTRVFPQPSER